MTQRLFGAGPPGKEDPPAIPHRLTNRRAARPELAAAAAPLTSKTSGEAFE